ncbi:meiosis-specific nuclear structural protein 1-like [Ischnura elegans]|uniref:meiosis-specific nuclear structural protein 1-like n=1 Tax=Ischnura elegans TaxID=197161 RepID=UPI001ED8B235|nr:meiosis-specific nuclear structural protein 1-like [Ischnura elegans]
MVTGRIQRDLEAQKMEEWRALINKSGKNLNNEPEVCRQMQFVEMKLRQRLREESVELRELESKLKTAYVNKELHAQLAEKEADKLAQQYREEVALELMRKKWLEDDEAAKARKRSQVEAKEKYRTELHEQEEWAEQRRLAAYQDFLREKLIIDKIVQLIHEEDMREQEEAMEKKKRTKEQMDEFRRSQMIWKEKERLAIEEENRRIIEFLKEKEDAERQKQAAAKSREEARAAMTKALMDVIQEVEEKRQRREAAHQALLEEEVRAKAEGEVQLRMQEAMVRRQEEREAREWQRQRQMERLAKEAEQEVEEKCKMLELMAESERLEQLSVERRRRKEAEHRRAVQAVMEERRQLRERQMEALREEQRRMEDEQETRCRAIEQERLKMLQEHAKKLIGFLPKGVLRPSDLPLLGIDDATPGGDTQGEPGD